jgi:hypothetical protein
MAHLTNIPSRAVELAGCGIEIDLVEIAVAIVVVT